MEAKLLLRRDSRKEKEEKEETNPWINLDLSDVLACREKYMETGKNEKNYAYNLNGFSWFDKIPLDQGQGAIFSAAGVLPYFRKEQVKKLLDGLSFSRGPSLSLVPSATRKSKKKAM